MTSLYPARKDTVWRDSRHVSSWQPQASLMFCSATHQVVAYIYTEETFGSEKKRNEFWWSVNVQQIQNRTDALHFITTCSSVALPRCSSIEQAQNACEIAISEILHWLPNP